MQVQPSAASVRVIYYSSAASPPAEKELVGERPKTYKWLAALLEQLPPERVARYAVVALAGLKWGLLREDGNRARESILLGMQHVLAWRSPGVNDTALKEVYLVP